VPRRLPRAPRLPWAPRLPPLRLAPIRSAGSVELDRQTLRGEPLPPFIRWDEFLFRLRMRPGEHITIVGVTGSGKSVLARMLLRRRDYVAVLGTKNRDPELYGAFMRDGYVLVERFDAEPPPGRSRIIYRPRMSTPDEAGLDAQRTAFRRMLTEVYEVGRWTLYADEVWYLTNRLNLATILETFWTAGRSLEITLVASTQLPVSIPLLAFDQATHLFLFRNTDRRRIDRMAEFAGANREVVRAVIPRLPQHEFLYVNTRTGNLARSKVILDRGT
jgi:hypothetical protein